MPDPRSVTVELKGPGQEGRGQIVATLKSRGIVAMRIDPAIDEANPRIWTVVVNGTQVDEAIASLRSNQAVRRVLLAPDAEP